MDMETLRNNYGERIHALAQQYGLENVRIFGSVARGEAGPDSDIDILVHGLPGCKPITFRKEMQQLFGNIKVDIVDDKFLKRLLAPYILKDAVPL